VPSILKQAILYVHLTHLETHQCKNSYGTAVN